MMLRQKATPLDIYHPYLHHSLGNNLYYLKHPQREKVNIYIFKKCYNLFDF